MKAHMAEAEIEMCTAQLGLPIGAERYGCVTASHGVLPGVCQWERCRGEIAVESGGHD
ncbi:hypothetical protein CS8_054990 [Cupriavidus sp. 8B]